MISLLLQGSFRVNLTGTGFKVIMDNSWYNKGYKTVSRISIAKVMLITEVYLNIFINVT